MTTFSTTPTATQGKQYSSLSPQNNNPNGLWNSKMIQLEARMGGM